MIAFLLGALVGGVAGEFLHHWIDPLPLKKDRNPFRPIAPWKVALLAACVTWGFLFGFIAGRL